MSLSLPNRQDPLIVPTVSSTQEGTMTPTMLAALNASVVSTPINVYVNPVTGNDSNAGTLAAPLRTFAAGWARMASGPGLRRLNLSAGNFPVSAYQAFPVLPYLPGGESVVVIGTPVDSGLGTLVVTGTVASSSGGARRGITAAAHVGNFTGAALRFTSGASIGVRMLIEADDGSTFTLLNRVNSAVANGDTFVVELPGSVIQSVGGAGYSFTGCNTMAFKDVKLDLSDGGGVNFVEGVNVIAAENFRIQMENGGGVAVSDGSFIGPCSFDQPFLAPNPFSQALRSTCGAYVYSLDGSGSVIVRNNSTWGNFGRGGWIFSNFEIDVIERGSLYSGIVSAQLTCKLVVEQSNIVLNGRTSCHSIISGSLLADTAVGILYGSTAEITELDQGLSLGEGITVDIASTLYLRGNLSLGANATYGIDIQDSSVVALSAPGGTSSCAITGTTAAILVGAVTKAYAALNGTRGYGETDGAAGPTGNRVNMSPN